MKKRGNIKKYNLPKKPALTALKTFLPCAVGGEGYTNKPFFIVSSDYDHYENHHLKGEITMMTERDARSILTKFGYVLEKSRGRFNLIDRRNGRFISFGHQMTVEDVEQWIQENLNLDNLTAYGK